MLYCSFTVALNNKMIFFLFMMEKCIHFTFYFFLASCCHVFGLFSIIWTFIRVTRKEISKTLCYFEKNIFSSKAPTTLLLMLINYGLNVTNFTENAQTHPCTNIIESTHTLCVWGLFQSSTPYFCSKHPHRTNIDFPKCEML